MTAFWFSHLGPSNLLNRGKPQAPSLLKPAERSSCISHGLYLWVRPAPATVTAKRGPDGRTGRRTPSARGEPGAGGRLSRAVSRPHRGGPGRRATVLDLKMAKLLAGSKALHHLPATKMEPALTPYFSPPF